MSAGVLEEAYASTASVLAQISPHQLDLSTPCASWTVRDVISHIVGGTSFIATAAETGTAPPIPDHPDEDLAAGEFTERFSTGAKRAVEAFRAEGVMEKTLKMPYGELPGGIVVWIAAIDTFVHGWDLAKAIGASTDLDLALATRLLDFARNIPYPRGAEGEAPFAEEVQVPASASPADKLAGLLGRQP
jgi:uncharacterized protein (TIGR03086 family)